MSIPLTYFWPLHAYDRRVQESVLRQFAEAGADGVNFNPSEMQAMMGDPGEILRWKRMLASAGVSFRDAHAPFGPLQDLSCPVPELFPHVTEMHRHCLRLCAEFGVESCTIHVGRPTEYGSDVALLHANLLRSLEAILPTAEACRCVVCIENIWDPTNTAGMLLDAIERFRSPWLGICWDSGHAQLSRSDTPDEWSDTGKYLERLLPHVVTCHLHSNDRILDRHWEPTDPRGLTDWAAEMPLLLSAPRMKQLQNEASVKPDHPVTVREHVESLRALLAFGKTV